MAPASGLGSTCACDEHSVYKGLTHREPSPCKQIKSSRLKQGLYKKTLDVDFAIFFFPFLITLESADLTKSGRTLYNAEPDPTSHSPGKG